MPIYLFACPTCKINFEELCRWEKRDEVRCEKCGGKSDQLPTTPGAIMFTNLKGTSKEDNFDYVARENYENAQRMRRAAEAQNTGGYEYSDPNLTNDISKYEGKVADIDPFEQ